MNFFVRPHFIALLLITLVAVGIERLIVTDAEAIEALGETVATAMEERDFEALDSLLDEAFQYRGRDRAETLKHVRSLLSKYKPTGIQIQLQQIEVDEDRATAKGVILGQAYGRPAQFQMDVVLQRTEEGWKLLEVKGDRLPR